MVRPWKQRRGGVQTYEARSRAQEAEADREREREREIECIKI